jgi:hypothetical protein
MTPTGTAKDKARSTNAKSAKADGAPQGKWKEVFLYGYACHESDDVMRLYHGLGVPQFYAIRKQDVLAVKSADCTQNPSMIKVQIPSTSRINYVSSRSVSLPAGSLATAVAARNKKGEGFGTEYCPASCICNNGCTCMAIDHWLNLGPESARKLGVVALSDPAHS